MASPCWVWAKSITLPPGRTASIAVRMSALPPTARMTASAPRPSVSVDHAFDDIFCAGVDGIGEAEARSDGVAFRKQIGSEDAGAGAASERGMHEADGALADDEDRIVSGEIEQLCALEHRHQRLDEGCLFEGHVVGNRTTPPIGDDKVQDANVLGKAAARRFESGSCASLLVERALRGSVFAAVVAFAAGNVVEAHHAVADGELVTPSPTAATTPAISWPKMRGAECEPMWIFLRSVPQTPQVAILMSSSPGPIWEPERFRCACR